MIPKDQYPPTMKANIMSPNQISLFEKFVSPTLAWYYNKGTNKWSIVHKIKQSPENPIFWVVCECNQKCFTANTSDLHPSPPSDALSIDQVIALTMKTLDSSLAQNNVCYDHIYYHIVTTVHNVFTFSHEIIKS